MPLYSHLLHESTPSFRQQINVVPTTLLSQIITLLIDCSYLSVSGQFFITSSVTLQHWYLYIICLQHWTELASKGCHLPGGCIPRTVSGIESVLINAWSGVYALYRASRWRARVLNCVCDFGPHTCPLCNEFFHLLCGDNYSSYLSGY